MNEELLLAELNESDKTVCLKVDAKDNKVPKKESPAESKVDSSKPPLVWVVQPGYNSDGTLNFKITTDSGVCLILKHKEAIESISILKESASASTTFFQIYAIKSNVSKVIPADQVEKAFDEVVAQATPALEGDNVISPDSATKSKKRLGQRFYRFFVRRRWKALVRRQVGIAVGDSRKGARLFSTIFPLLLLWKAFQRRSRQTV